MNKPFKDWTFTELEYFLTENDISVREVIALLGCGMVDMRLMASANKHEKMVYRYSKLIAVIMPLIVNDLA